MDTTSTPKILLVSGACCNPGLARHDQVVEKTLQTALGDLAMVAEVRKVSLSVVLAGGGDLSPKQRERIMALFHKHNVRFTPALFFDDTAKFVGTAPTLSQLKEALQGALEPQS